jgi:predicted transcriptional regulator
MEEFIILPKKELEVTLYAVLDDFEKKKLKKEQEEKSFSINQVAKRIGRSHTKTKQLINSGILKSTKDGRVLESSIIGYFSNE